jgi:hypothetical protein
MKKVRLTDGMENKNIYVDDSYVQKRGRWRVVSEERLPINKEDVVFWALGGTVQDVPTKWGIVRKLILPDGVSIPMGHHNNRGIEALVALESNDQMRPAIERFGTKDKLLNVMGSVEEYIEKAVEAYLKTQ